MFELFLIIAIAISFSIGKKKCEEGKPEEELKKAIEEAELPDEA